MLWVVAGAAMGFSIAALTSIGMFTVLPSALFVLMLLMLRVPGFWAGVCALGVTAAALQLSLVIDPNAPDDDLLPVFAGAGAALLGAVLFRSHRRGRSS